MLKTGAIFGTMTYYKMCSSVNTIALLYKSHGYFLPSKQETWPYTDNEKDKIIILADDPCCWIEKDFQITGKVGVGGD